MLQFMGHKESDMLSDWTTTAIQHRELYSVLCGDLNGKAIKK